MNSSDMLLAGQLDLKADAVDVGMPGDKSDGVVGVGVVSDVFVDIDVVVDADKCVALLLLAEDCDDDL